MNILVTPPEMSRPAGDMLARCMEIAQMQGRMACAFSVGSDIGGIPSRVVVAVSFRTPQIEQLIAPYYGKPIAGSSLVKGDHLVATGASFNWELPAGDLIAKLIEFALSNQRTSAAYIALAKVGDSPFEAAVAISFAPRE